MEEKPFSELHLQMNRITKEGRNFTRDVMMMNIIELHSSKANTVVT
jgi:hypothetical protein